jgi:hypothetical protein
MNNTTDTVISMSTMSMVFSTGTMTPIYSSTWTPTSTGGYAGTCIFLIILATTFRGLLAVKVWKEKAWLDAEFDRRYITIASKLPESEHISSDDRKGMTLTENRAEEVMVVKKRPQPWRITQDPIRAIIDTVIAGVGYLL